MIGIKNPWAKLGEKVNIFIFFFSCNNFFDLGKRIYDCKQLFIS